MPGLSSRWSTALILGAALAAGCSQAMRSIQFVTPELNDAYIPLYTGTIIGSSRFAAAVVVAPNVAVTNDHNLNLLSEETVLARSPAYDLLFFRTERTRVPMIARPRVGQAVIAYGQDGRTRRREAAGIVRQLDARARALCAGCPERPTITYDAEAGEGFSGGPLVDAVTGAVVGITVGYLDGAAEGGGRRMYAMEMEFVMSEMRRLMGATRNSEIESQKSE
jgi:S1-C subfamily serine protease